MSTEAPVLIISYNRPERTRQIIETVRSCYQGQIFAFSDGPKGQNDEALVEAVRETIRSLSPSTVHESLLSPANLGCRKGVTAALDWFFANVEQGFVLEDDCLPNRDFFDLGNHVLEKYKFDTTVMQYSGRMPLRPRRVPREVKKIGFGFDPVGSTWGWATWRRAWQQFDRELSLLPQLPKKESSLISVSPHRVADILRGYQSVAEGRVDTWDYQWALSKLMAGGLTVVPAGNLVKNIGFDSLATHTKKKPPMMENKLRSVTVDFLAVPPPSSTSGLIPRLERLASRKKTLARLTKPLNRIASLLITRPKRVLSGFAGHLLPKSQRLGRLRVHIIKTPSEPTP